MNSKENPKTTTGGKRETKTVKSGNRHPTTGRPESEPSSRWSNLGRPGQEKRDFKGEAKSARAGE